MNEHEDDSLPRVTDSTATVDSAADDGIVAERGKIEGDLGERDEGEDMMVDVVGADDHGGTGVDLDGKKSSDGVKEGFDGVKEGLESEPVARDSDREGASGAGEEVCDDSGGIRVLGLEKGEEGVKGNVVSGSDESKTEFERSSVEPERGLAEEIVAGPMESAREVADEDDGMDGKSGKEDRILDSSKIQESLDTTANLGSPEVDKRVEEKGLLGKDEAEDGADNEGTGEAAVDISTKNEVDQTSKEESLHPTTEVATNDNGNPVVDSEMAVVSSIGEPESVGEEIDAREEESERGLTEETVEQPVESVKEVGDGDHVMNETTEKEDEVLVSANLGSEEVDVVVADEGSAGKDEAQDGVYEAPIRLDNHSLSTEAINGGTGEGGARLKAVNLDQQAEVEERSKEESSCSMIDVRMNDAQKSNISDESVSRDPHSIEGEISVMDNKEETERSLTEGTVELAVMDKKEVIERGLIEEIVKQPMESIQEAADVDRVMDEKLEKGNEVLESSKLPESSIMADHGPEEVNMVVVDEGLAGKDQTQDGASVNPSSVHSDDQTLSKDDQEKGKDGDNLDQKSEKSEDGENSDPKAELDPVSKDESPHPTIEVVTIAATHESSKISDLASAQPSSVKDGTLIIDNEVEGSKFQALEECSKTEVAARTEVDEVATTTQRKSNSEEQIAIASGILVENQKLKVDPEIESSRPISSTDQTVPNTGVENCKVELPTGDMSHSLEDRGPIVKATVCANPSNDQIPPTSSIEVAEVHIGAQSSTVDVPNTSEMNGFQVSAKDFEETNRSKTDDAEHGVLPADSKFLYEAHVERAEDAGMDIDEVLGWKDEIPAIDGEGCREKDQHIKIYATSETNIEQGDPNEPALIGQQGESLKFRQSIVYERRAHSEVLLLDENSKVEAHGNSEEGDGSVQPENPSSDDKKVKEDLELHMDYCRGDQETEALELGSEAEHSTGIDEVAENETLVSLQQSCYFRPPENEGEFSASDLVWGKVRSHPWWPGQIFNPSDASEKAMKYHKKDRFLVAYFGDRTFAWNDSSVLKPFRKKFSQIVKHGSSESFRNAVNCALEEVSRRVALGLSCSCVSRDIYEKIEYQTVENAGIKQEASKRHGLDKSAGVSSFEPDKLVDYVKLVAKFPYDEGNEMELIMAKAQLSSYGRYKGYRNLPEFLFCGNLLEDASIIVNDALLSVKKEKSSSDIPNEAPQDEDGAEGQDGNITSGSKKRKVLDSTEQISDGSEKRPTVGSSSPKPSFKVGECIQRVATQLTGGSDDKKVEQTDQFADSVQNPENSLAEMLSQLRLAAQDPMKGYAFSNTIIPFFYSHRSSIFVRSLRQNLSAGRPTEARKRKPSNENDPEEFEFDDVNDSYWTDRVIQNQPEEQLIQESQNGGGEEYRIVNFEQEKPAKPTRRSNKKRYFSSNHEIEAKEQSELIERRRQNLATEVLLKFQEGIYFPSEIHLNKMFRRFGPLMESETEVDRQSGRARVVFKKCSDAEVAHSSCGKFNVFGSINVNYELNYNPLVSYKPLPLPTVQDPAGGAC